MKHTLLALTLIMMIGSLSFAQRDPYDTNSPLLKFQAADFQGEIPRRNAETLDDVCLLSFGGSPAIAYMAFETGEGIKIWVDPAECVSNPGYPFMIQDVTFTAADGSLFGFEGEGVGTVTYRINIGCAANGCTDPCEVPFGEIICETPDIVHVCNDEGVQYFTATLNCCVEGPFFVGLEYVSWTGAWNFVPAPLWDSEVQPYCQQYMNYDGTTYYDDVADLSPFGTVLLDVTGNTNDACAPVSCDIIGACCNHLTGACIDGVRPCDCSGLYDEFVPNETCATLDPPCAPCPPLAQPDALVIQTVGPDAILTWNAANSVGSEFCPNPNYYLVFFEEESGEDPDFLAYTPDTSFVHSGVVQFSSQMFYTVESYIGSVGALAAIVERDAPISRTDFLALINSQGN